MPEADHFEPTQLLATSPSASISHSRLRIVQIDGLVLLHFLSSPHLSQDLATRFARLRFLCSLVSSIARSPLSLSRSGTHHGLRWHSSTRAHRRNWPRLGPQHDWTIGRSYRQKRRLVDNVRIRSRHSSRFLVFCSSMGVFSGQKNLRCPPYLPSTHPCNSSYPLFVPTRLSFQLFPPDPPPHSHERKSPGEPEKHYILNDSDVGPRQFLQGFTFSRNGYIQEHRDIQCPLWRALEIWPELYAGWNGMRSGSFERHYRIRQTGWVSIGGSSKVLSLPFALSADGFSLIPCTQWVTWSVNDRSIACTKAGT